MLAVMAALAHRKHPEINTALDTLAEALSGIELESAAFFAHYVEVGLGEGGAYDHWKSIIMTMTYPFASKLRDELEARGREKGRTEGRAEALFALLALRGIALTTAQRERVLHCEDERTYLTWLGRAASADSAEEVFAAAGD